MKRHSNEIILKILDLRYRGLSISDISKITSISKTTIWHHVKDITLSDAQKRVFVENQRTGSQAKSKSEWQRADVESKTIINKVGDLTPLFPIILSILYWAEGRKENSFEFINTDRRMIILFLKILREFFKIDTSRITPVLRINSSMNRDACVNYWVQATHLPICAFLVDTNDKNNKTKSSFGLCRIRVRKGGYLLKLTTSLIQEIARRIGE